MHMDLQTSAWGRWKLEPFTYVILWILVLALLLILWILNENIVLRRFCTRRNYFSLLLFLLKHNLKYVPSLTFKTCRFMHWGESQGAVDISLLYLCQFLPIFVSFVAISAGLCHHFKTMSLVKFIRYDTRSLITKTTTLQVHYFFCTFFSSIFAGLCYENSYFFAFYMENVNKKWQSFISFCELGYASLELSFNQ